MSYRVRVEWDDDRAEPFPPKCGEDFCEACGDCIHCYGDDPCYPDEGDHFWFITNARRESDTSNGDGE